MSCVSAHWVRILYQISGCTTVGSYVRSLIWGYRGDKTLFPGTVDHYLDSLTRHGCLVSFHRLFEFESMSDERFDVDPARSYHVKSVLVS